MGLALNERTKVKALINADKQVHISYQALKVAIEFFSELNKLIMDKIEDSEKSGNVQMERNLILGNAILVYELTDFVINYIETFEIEGVNEILELYKQESKRLEKLLVEQKGLKEKAQSDEIDPQVKALILSDIKARESSIEIIVNEWRDYVKTIEETQNEAGSVSKKLPTLKLIRDNAKSQISLIEAIAVMQIVKRNLSAIEAAILTLEKIELITLSPTRVRRLLGIGN